MIPTALLSRFARRHVTVALGGDGSDELLAGYPTFIADRFRPFFSRLPHGVISALRHAASYLPPATRTSRSTSK